VSPIIAKHRAALSNSLAGLKRHLGELPRDKENIAYHRGPLCLISGEAVALLRKRNF